MAPARSNVILVLKSDLEIRVRYEIAKPVSTGCILSFGYYTMAAA
jgi:hypothetical protein